jgi:hypothetical protein
MTEHDQRRLVHHRLAVLGHSEEVCGNVSATCRCNGISRQCLYKWRNRLDELGDEGFRDRSSRSHHSPNETDPDVVGNVIYLRQKYHFGPYKMSLYLKRYNDIATYPSGV